MHVIELVVEPDFGQFYLCRSGAQWASDAVTSEGCVRSLWSNGSFVYVGTDRKFGSTPLRIELLDGSPAGPPDSSCQHIAEISLDPGGKLEVYDWNGGTPNVVVAIDPGSVRLRMHWTGLITDRFEGMDDPLGRPATGRLTPGPSSAHAGWWPRFVDSRSDEGPERRLVVGRRLRRPAQAARGDAGRGRGVDQPPALTTPRLRTRSISECPGRNAQPAVAGGVSVRTSSGSTQS